MARWRDPPGGCHPIHSDRDAADQPAIVEPDTGSAVSAGRSATRTLGQVARREKRAQYSRALAIPLSRRLHEIGVTGEGTDGESIRALLVAETIVIGLGHTLNPVPQNCQARRCKLHAR